MTFLLPLFEAGFITDVVASLLVGGGLAGLLALRKDAIGTTTRDIVGEKSNQAALATYEKVVELEKEYEVTKNVREKSKLALDELTKKIKDGLN